MIDVKLEFQSVAALFALDQGPGINTGIIWDNCRKATPGRGGA
jgi:hypothetical protein